MRKILVSLYLIILFSILCFSEGDIDYLIGRWELKENNTTYKGMKFFTIDKDDDGLSIKIHSVLKLPLEFDSKENILSYNMSGKGPDGNIEILKFENDTLNYYTSNNGDFVKQAEFYKK